MTTIPAGTTAPTASLRKVVVASMIGTTIEWYDFFLYGSASALVFGKLFFPKADPTTGVMLSFATYALGFAARPLGGLVFGHFGDRIGRKQLLMLSLLLMGGSSMLIGVLPTFAQVGLLAPLGLVLLRLVQGFAVGGEWGGAVLMVTEYGDAKRRGFWAGWPQAGVPAGNLLAAAVLAVMSAVVSNADFLAWGWRVPFLLSGVLVAIGYWVRISLAESPLFQKALDDAGAPPKAPMMDAIRERPGGIAIGAGLRIAENITFYVVTTFGLTYIVDHAHLARSQALNAMLIGTAVEVVLIPIFAGLSDKVGRRPLYFLGAAGIAGWGFVFFRLIDTGQMPLIVLAIIGGLVCHGLMYGPQAAFIAELFPTRMRYSGASLAYQATSIVAGSLAPIIALALLDRFKSWVPIAIYLAIAGAISAFSALKARETKGLTFAEIDAIRMTATVAAPAGKIARIPPSPALRRRVMIASAIGTTVEWYDFLLYGTAAALVFGKVFFPKSDPLTGTMFAFATYGVGFMARPIGGIIFGHFGDRIGRKRLLIISLILMGTATFLIGLLPTFNQVGVLAPILLVALRLVQGFGLGGQWGGAILMSAEFGEAKHRGLWTGFTQAGGGLGNFLATGVLAVMAATLSQADFLAWGWRIPFLLSFVLIGIGLWARMSLVESPVFQEAVETANEGAHAAPVLEVLRRMPGRVVLGGALKFGENISFYLMTAFAITYVTEMLHLSRSVALNGVLAGALAATVSMPLWAALSDRIGRRPVYAFGAGGLMIWAFAFYPLLETRSPGLIIAAIVVGLLVHSAMNGPQGAVISELFPTRTRYSGASLCYQVTSIVGGSWAPIISLALFKQFHSTLPISIYLAGSCAVSLIATILARETKGLTFAQIDART